MRSTKYASFLCSLFSQAYCVGIRDGGEPAWNFAVAHYARTSVATERERVLTALACTDDPTTVKKFVDDVLNKDGGVIERPDAMTALHAVAGTSAVGRRHLLDTVVNQWDQVSWLFGSGRTNVGNIFVALARGMSTTDDLEKVCLKTPNTWVCIEFTRNDYQFTGFPEFCLESHGWHRKLSKTPFGTYSAPLEGRFLKNCANEHVICNVSFVKL